ncbi:MAG: DEAD/DEAH box helicase [Candidatus Micrarchaeia archaeon]
MERKDFKHNGCVRRKNERNSETGGKKMKENTFEELALRPETLRAVKEMGFTKPTPIQKEAIPLLALGMDIIGQAETGSGKTAAFGIHILESIDKSQISEGAPQALILTPTRELAVQVAQEIRNLGKYHYVSVVTIYGGASLNVQAEQLEKGAQIVVGTPGRIIDMMERRALKLGSVHIIVLDEADRMLDMGFIDEVKMILDRIPRNRQTLLFSATMPDEVRELAGRYMRNPQDLAVSTDAVPIDKIKQIYVLVERKDKFHALLNLLKLYRPRLALVFVNTKVMAGKLAFMLNKERHKTIALHGNLSQKQRDTAMHAFRQGRVHILVATDIAARGIDVSGITHVINYDLPMDPIIYSHRVGRTARAGARGMAISIITPEQSMELRDIQRITGVRLKTEHIEGEASSEFFSGGSDSTVPTGYRGYGRDIHSQRKSHDNYYGKSAGGSGRHKGHEEHGRYGRDCRRYEDRRKRHDNYVEGGGAYYYKDGKKIRL